MAEQLHSMVLSGDNKLKKVCLKRNIEAHGILWVICAFIKQDLITPKLAKEKLEALIDFNKWLPIEECENLLNNWS